MTAPIKITTQITGAIETIEHLEGIPIDRRKRVARTIYREGVELSNVVKRDYLTGQSLNVRTGRLRGSINDRFEDTGDTIVTTVGTAVPYGAFWELGYVGVQQVRAHTRRVKARDTRGKIGGLTKSGRPRRGVTSQGVTFVREHQRRVSEPARPFLRPALDARRAAVVEALRRAVAGE